MKQLKSFIDNTRQYPLDEIVIDATINLTQLYKIKTPDAIIAATALAYNLTLISRNINDFKNIIGLKVINPHSL